MKKLILSIFVIGTLAACKNDPKIDTANRDIQFLSDSVVYNNTAFSDTAETAEAEIVPEKVTQPPKVIVKTIRIHDKSPVSAPVYTQPASVPPVAATPPVVSVPENTSVGNSSETGNANGGDVATVPEVEKKKGWSKAAQGAAIGGVTGAVGGAILSKKKGLGAVIGGVVGAAGGYIIGKKMDKKDNDFIMK